MSIGQGSILVQSKKETGTGNIPANNGLVFQDDNVQLGGGLIRETSIGLNTIGPFSIDGAIGSHLFFDITNGVYFFGYDTNGDQQLVTGWNFNETNQIEGRVAAKVGLRVVESINGLEFYAGDINEDGNGTKIFIDDNNGDISLGDLSDNLNSIKLKISNQFRNITMGDPDGEQNGTTLTIDDSTQSVEITNVPAGAITDDFATFDGDQIKKIPAPVESGTYTPFGYVGFNVNTVTPSIAQFLRVGNVVTVSGSVEVDINAANTLSSFYLSLPINSNFTAESQAGGAGGTAGASYLVTYQTCSICADDGTPNQVYVSFQSIGTGNEKFFYSYTYQIIDAP